MNGYNVELTRKLKVLMVHPQWTTVMEDIYVDRTRSLTFDVYINADNEQEAIKKAKALCKTLNGIRDHRITLKSWMDL